jgi:hypothetical protein
MKLSVRCIVAACLTLGLAFSALAQPAGGGMGGGAGKYQAIFAKLYGEVKAFSATADIQIKGKNDMSMPMEFAMLDGKTRTEMDLSQMKGAGMPEGMGAQLKQMGMERMISMVDLEKKTVQLLYPGLKAYAEMPMPKEEAELAGKEPKVERTEMGKETIEGHDCKKVKVVITDSEAKKHEVLVWNASDLKEFPVKFVMTEDGNEVTLIYKKLKFEKPAASVFAIPAEYTKYESMQAMMQGAMMRMMQQK